MKFDQFFGQAADNTWLVPSDELHPEMEKHRKRRGQSQPAILNATFGNPGSPQFMDKYGKNKGK